MMRRTHRGQIRDVVSATTTARHHVVHFEPPATHQEVLNTYRLFGEHVIPHFKAKEKRAAAE